MIHGNIPIEKRRPPISEDLKESIKYMRKRVDIKHRNRELDLLEQEQKRKQKILEAEMAKDDNGKTDFSKFMFDNSTGKVTDISKDFRLSAMFEEAKKKRFANEMVSTKTQAEILEDTDVV